MGNSVTRGDFFTEMAERQITAREFFNSALLEAIERYFNISNLVILYFDTEGEFLSWVSKEGVSLNHETHPYQQFSTNDVVRNVLFHDASRDKLTYFDVEPRLYKSTDIIDLIDYEHSAYVRFINENFDAHYSVSMAFGMNGYIQMVFLKTKEMGDFTEMELEELEQIYVYVANSYKNFKKYEHGKIVSDIQNQIIASGERAYLIVDDFKNILSYNENAEKYLRKILGPLVGEEFTNRAAGSWLPILFGNMPEITDAGVYIRKIQEYVLKIHVYNRTYSNGIIDRYHWITIENREEVQSSALAVECLPLTKTEIKITELMYQGLTYKAIAQELVVSYHTVKKHVQNIYIKCNVNSRYELYKYIEEKEK